MEFSGIIAITNRNGESVLADNPLADTPLDFYLFSASSSSCLFHSPVFHSFLLKLYDFARYLNQYKHSMIQLCGTISYALCNQSTLHFCISFGHT